MHNINIEVILASQAHQVPHVGFPHIEPVTKAIKLNTNPEGAKLFAIKKNILFLKTITKIERVAINENMPSTSSLGEKSSDIVGQIELSPNNFFKMWS